MKYEINLKENHLNAVQNMSIKDLLYLVCCPNYISEDCHPKRLDTATAFIHKGDSDYHKTMMNLVTKDSTQAPFVCSDFEAGPGTMISDGTKFPSLFSCSVTGKPELAYGMGKAAALEGRNLGYNWTLGPAIDICVNPDTPTTSNRSAGITPKEVMDYGLSYIRGCQDHGMIATAKHFPGDGFGIYDQHLTTPEIPLTVDEWNKTSGKVYKHVIDGGVMSIMPGHLSFPAYDEVWEKNGEYPPATLSKKLLTDLLKNELGFDGIIISDAVKMVGFSGFMNFFEACARFLEYGGDILLFANPDAEFVKELTVLINRGILKIESLQNRAARVLAFKEQVVREFRDISIDYNVVNHQATADEVIKESITIMRDRDNLLPIKDSKNKKILHLIISSPHFSKISLLESFKTNLENEFQSVEQWVDPGNRKIIQAVKNRNFDLIICSIGTDYNFGTNVIRFHGPQARNLMGGWSHMGIPVLFISHFHPFIHQEYKALMDCVINTHGTLDSTLPILAQKICGKQKLKKSKMNPSRRDWSLRGWLDD